MEKVLLCKFTQHENLANILLGTGNARIYQVWVLNADVNDPPCIIQDSPIDSFWGTGEDGRGQNQLGILLMETRSMLKDLYLE